MGHPLDQILHAIERKRAPGDLLELETLGCYVLQPLSERLDVLGLQLDGVVVPRVEIAGLPGAGMINLLADY